MQAHAPAVESAPRVDCATLKDLSRLLIDRGFRRSSSGEVRVAEETAPSVASAQAAGSSIQLGITMTTPGPLRRSSAACQR